MNGNDVTVFNLTQHTPKSVINVAILGAESTGKTTLCRDLAAYFGSPWVPEYMRTYLQKKWNVEEKTCAWDDLLPIAQGQIALENKLALQAEQTVPAVKTAQHTIANRQYLFCDTSSFELMVYANWYYGDCPDALTKAALAHHYDLILLTKVDIPWVADDLRDSPHGREEISARFAAELIRYNKPFRCIGGDRDQRVFQVVGWLNGFN
ncbi:AAA family ATPase [Psychrobacter frigidicola]|uniref:AAA family ATPase n=1 Tax=Psychrobacter frigidicola TaxID=45611 RepID=UPI001918A830|nr:ATP-binding protein [Psychrobacter frigidicola]